MPVLHEALLIIRRKKYRERVVISILNPKTSFFFQNRTSPGVRVGARLCACARRRASSCMLALRIFLPLLLRRARLGPREKDGETNQGGRGGERSAPARLQEGPTQTPPSPPRRSSWRTPTSSLPSSQRASVSVRRWPSVAGDPSARSAPCPSMQADRLRETLTFPPCRDPPGSPGSLVTLVDVDGGLMRETYLCERRRLEEVGPGERKQTALWKFCS